MGFVDWLENPTPWIPAFAGMTMLRYWGSSLMHELNPMDPRLAVPRNFFSLRETRLAVPRNFFSLRETRLAVPRNFVSLRETRLAVPRNFFSLRETRFRGDDDVFFRYRQIIRHSRVGKLFVIPGRRSRTRNPWGSSIGWKTQPHGFPLSRG